MLSGGAPKRIRLDEGEIWTGPSNFGNDFWRRPYIGEAGAVMQGIQSSKRQDCGCLVQRQWNDMDMTFGGSQDLIGSVSNRMKLELEGRPQRTRDTNLGFVQAEYTGPGSRRSFSFRPNWATGNAVVEIPRHDSGPVGDRVGICSTLRCTESADMGTMTTYRNAEGPRSPGCDLGEWKSCSEASFLRINGNQGHFALQERNGSDTSRCTYPGIARFSVSDIAGNSMSNRGPLYAHTSNVGRRPCKRKSSMAGITSSLPFRGSNPSGRWESNRSGTSRSEMGNTMWTNADIFCSATSTPMAPKPHHLRDGEMSLHSLRSSPVLKAPNGSSNRFMHGMLFLMQQEQNQSQLQPLCFSESRRSTATMSTPMLMPRILANERGVEFAENINSTLNVGFVLHHNHSGTGINHSNCVGSAGIFEGNQLMNSSHASSSWHRIRTIESRLPNQFPIDAAGRATSAWQNGALNNRESLSHVSHVAALSLAHPGSVASQSSAHLSNMLLNRCNTFPSQGRLLPPTASGAPINLLPGVSIDSQASSSSIHRVFPPAMPSWFQGAADEGGLASPMQSLLRMPSRRLHILPAAVRGNRNRSIDQELLDQSIVYNGVDITDQHSDMRLDVDNMSYEELLALGERIGNVNTGLSEDNTAKCLKMNKYSSSDVSIVADSQESEVKCSICQMEYLEEDELGKLDCGHSHHTACIKQWLSVKNQCPICKAAAYSET